MGNVYEVKLKENVYIIEVDENLDIENENTLDILKKHYGGGDSFEIKKSNEKPEKIFSTKMKRHCVTHDEDGNYLDERYDQYWVEDGLVPYFTNNFTPENTKSVLYYFDGKYRRTTKLPNNVLYFHFSIESDELEELWEKGDLKKLSQYLIKPTEQFQRNPVNTYNKIFDRFKDKWGDLDEEDVLENIDGNSPEWFDEMYRRKNKYENPNPYYYQGVRIVFYTNQEWKISENDLGRDEDRKKGIYQQCPF